VVGDLTSPTPAIPAGSPLVTDPAYSAFDVAAMSLALHHVDDPSLAVRRLTERLRPGGVLVVVEFLRHDAMAVSHPAKKSVVHDGFATEEIKKIFEDAGCGGDFAVAEMEGVEFPIVHGTGGHPQGHGHIHEHRHGHGHGHGHEDGHHHLGGGASSGVSVPERRAFIARGSKL